MKQCNRCTQVLLSRAKIKKERRIRTFNSGSLQRFTINLFLFIIDIVISVQKLKPPAKYAESFSFNPLAFSQQALQIFYCRSTSPVTLR